MDAISTTKYDAIQLDEYKGSFSIKAMKKGKSEGEFYNTWAKYKKGKDEYQEKDWPIKVAIGDKATAAGVLKMLLEEISGNSWVEFKKESGKRPEGPPEDFYNDGPTPF